MSETAIEKEIQAKGLNAPRPSPDLGARRLSAALQADGCGMTDLESLLSNAKFEIESLRRQNEILRAKVEMIDLFACVLHTEPARRSEGMAPDVAWALQKKIDEIKAQPKPRPTVAELDAILNGKDDRDITINPDGSISAN